MDLKLKGKLALVSGSTKGIGFAIAKRLADEGARVVVNGRGEDSTRQAAEAIGSAAHPIAADLGTAAGVEGFVEKAKALGLPEILVNNLGIFEPGDFFELSDDAWQRFFEINVMSAVRLSRALMPGMLDAGWGRIVNISSESGLNIPKEMVHYGMTKTALLALSRGLAELTEGTDVTVNSVLPGPTWSEGVAEFVTELAEQKGMDVEKFKSEVFFREARPTQLLKRFTEPEEIATMVAYVVSPLASATNGGALRADGGTVKSIVP